MQIISSFGIKAPKPYTDQISKPLFIKIDKLS